MIKLGIIEDEPLVRENLQQFFEGFPNVNVTISANSVESFLEQYSPAIKVDVLLLDINLPGISGLEGIRHIKYLLPDLDILILTAHDDSEHIFKALCAGAASYMSKRSSLKTIGEAVVIVSQGGAYMSPGIARKVIEHFAPKKQESEDLLTPRQLQIVQGLVDGLSYKLIADKYMISMETVRDHIKKIYKKLQVNSKAEVIRKKLDGEI